LRLLKFAELAVGGLLGRAHGLSEVPATTLDARGGFLGGDPALRGAYRHGVAQRVPP